jgi:alpha-L-arabinofuranosidase
LAHHLDEPDLSATMSADGSTLRIYAVNSTQGKRKVRISLKGFAGQIAGARVFKLADGQRAGDSEAMNTHDDPNRVSVSVIDAPINGSLIEYAFEPLTVTLLECRLRKPL